MKADYCCLDASAFSLGFAASHSGTLIIEKSENVLSNYVNPVAAGIVTEPQTKEGRAFSDYLKRAGCVSDKGILDSPSLAPAAAEYALETGFNILLGAKIISCENKRIQVYTNSGIQYITCNRIIRCPKAAAGRKKLNCIVSGVDYAVLSEFEKFGRRITESFEKDEFILSLEFMPDCRLNEARIAFVNKIKACFGTSVRIDAFASDFDFGSEYSGIIEEFEAGVGYELL